MAIHSVFELNCDETCYNNFDANYFCHKTLRSKPNLNPST